MLCNYDGAETDLDLGHYDFNTETSQANNVTTGKVYKTVIEKERKRRLFRKTVRLFLTLQMKSKEEYEF